MQKNNLDRINELARLARERALTEEEASERQALRQAYLAEFRSGFKRQLESTWVQYPDGTKTPLKDLNKR